MMRTFLSRSGRHIGGRSRVMIESESPKTLGTGSNPALSWERSTPLDLRNMYHCSVSERAAYHEAIWFPHYLFLGDRKEIDTIADAIFKVLENIEELRGLDHPAVRAQGLSRADRES